MQLSQIGWPVDLEIHLYRWQLGWQPWHKVGKQLDAVFFAEQVSVSDQMIFVCLKSYLVAKFVRLARFVVERGHG